MNYYCLSCLPSIFEWQAGKKKNTFQDNQNIFFKSPPNFFFYIRALYWHKHNSLCAIFIISFFLLSRPAAFPLGEGERWVSEWICSRRLQWAEISFSGSRQEGRCEMGEALSSPPTPTLVDRCGKCLLWTTVCGCVGMVWFSSWCCYRQHKRHEIRIFIYLIYSFTPLSSAFIHFVLCCWRVLQQCFASLKLAFASHSRSPVKASASVCWSPTAMRLSHFETFVSRVCLKRGGDSVDVWLPPYWRPPVTLRRVPKLQSLHQPFELHGSWKFIHKLLFSISLARPPPPPPPLPSLPPVLSEQPRLLHTRASVDRTTLNPERCNRLRVTC